MALDVAFRNSLDYSQHTLQNLNDPSRLYVSDPIRRHITSIDNGIKHLRFDDNLLQRSTNWRKQFCEQQLDDHRSSVVGNLQRGQPLFNDYASTMNRDHLNTLRDCQVSQNYITSMQNFNTFRQDFDPHAQVAHDRVQRFCDWVGVTDRYTGYRNNLSRGSRVPLQMEPAWKRGQAARSDPPLIHPKFVAESISVGTNQRFNIRSKSAPAKRVQFDKPSLCQPSFADKTPQEMAGIPTKFPGTTEHKDRYLRPMTASQKPYDYNINPSPDFRILGRKFVREVPEARDSEYESRYVWPDSSKIDPTPWKRGCY